MLLKLLILGGLLYTIYRFLGGRILPNKKVKKSTNDKESVEDIETLVECNTCSTYVVKKEAISYQGKWYCSTECLSKENKNLNK